MKNIKVYYYNLSTTVSSFTQEKLLKILKKLYDESYIVNEIEKWIFSFYVPKEKYFEIIPKIWKRKNFSVKELTTLPIWEDQNLYEEIYYLLNTNVSNFYPNSLWILAIAKTWKIDKNFNHNFLNKIFNWKFYQLEVLTYSNKEKYLDSIKKITSFSFTMMWWVNQWNLIEDSSIQEALNFKNKFWWEEITITVKNKEKWLIKDFINKFFRNNQNSLKNNRIEIDDAWERIDNELDKLRILGSIEIDNSKKNIDKDEVFNKMLIDFKTQIERIKQDLT